MEVRGNDITKVAERERLADRELKYPPYLLDYWRLNISARKA